MVLLYLGSSLEILLTTACIKTLPSFPIVQEFMQSTVKLFTQIIQKGDNTDIDNVKTEEARAATSTSVMKIASKRRTELFGERQSLILYRTMIDRPMKRNSTDFISSTFRELPRLANSVNFQLRSQILVRVHVPAFNDTLFSQPRVRASFFRDQPYASKLPSSNDILANTSAAEAESNVSLV